MVEVGVAELVSAAAFLEVMNVVGTMDVVVVVVVLEGGCEVVLLGLLGLLVVLGLLTALLVLDGVVGAAGEVVVLRVSLVVSAVVLDEDGESRALAAAILLVVRTNAIVVVAAGADCSWCSRKANTAPITTAKLASSAVKVTLI
jgi:hypothetical protein